MKRVNQRFSGVRVIAAVFAGVFAAICLYLAIYAFASAQMAGGIRALLAFICLAVGVVFLIPKKKKSKIEEPESDGENAPSASFRIQTVATFEPEIPEQPDGFPKKRGYFIRYSYTDVRVASRDRYADIILHPGDILTFEPEPDNQFDSGAVRIKRGTDKIGYMYRGRLQDMCRDFIERNDKVAGVVVSDDNGLTVFNMAFYQRQKKETVIDEVQY